MPKESGGRADLPLRVPPEVPLGTVDPPYMTTGSIGTWRLTLHVPREIAGDALLLTLGGHRWVKLDTICQNEDPEGEGYISGRVRDGPDLAPIPRPSPKKIHDLMKVTFRVPNEGIPKGSTLEFLLGDTSGGSPGLRGPRSTVRNVFFPLTLEPKPPSMANHDFNWLGAFILDFQGGPLDNLRVLAPSQVGKEEEFSVTIRPQDRFGCISPEAPRNLVLTVDGSTQGMQVREDNLNPAGAIEVEGLRLNREGVSHVLVEDPSSGLEARSNPIVVGQRDRRLLWGVIHEHTEVSDGTGSLDLCYQNMRYGSRLDFGAASDHDHRFETTDEMWRMTVDAAARHNDEGRFTTLLGYEWAKWRRNGDGDRNVYYPGDEGNMYRSETGEYDTPGKLFSVLKGQEALIIPHHTAYTGNFCDWSQHDPDKERLVEIYSVWGSSEASVNEGNPMPVRTARAFNPEWIAVSGEKPSPDEEPVGMVQKALAQGWRVGFTGGGDMHRSHPGDDVRHGFPPYQYKTGLTGVWAERNTRQSVYTSLKSRCCYATTGSRMILWMSVNGHAMGSESILEDGGSRSLEFNGIGTDEIRLVEFIRNNKVVFEAKGDGREDMIIRWVDEDKFEDVALPSSKWASRPFLFYYARMTQEDGEMGWTSPVWMEKG